MGGRNYYSMNKKFFEHRRQRHGVMKVINIGNWRSGKEIKRLVRRKKSKGDRVG